MKHAREDYNRIQDPENKIPENEPVFLIRGQDKLSVATLRRYVELAEDNGVNQDVIDLTNNQIDSIIEWQASQKTKLPDVSKKLDNPWFRIYYQDGDSIDIQLQSLRRSAITKIGVKNIKKNDGPREFAHIITEGTLSDFSQISP